MTRDKAKRNQNEIAKNFNLGWWYGTNCKPCCGGYPKFMHTGDLLHCFYQCEVCGSRTAPFDMPWQAEKAWNEGRIIEGAEQFNMFEECE